MYLEHTQKVCSVGTQIEASEVFAIHTWNVGCTFLSLDSFPQGRNNVTKRFIPSPNIRPPLLLALDVISSFCDGLSRVCLG